MDELKTHILTGIVSFAVGYFLKNLEPKAKLIWWSTHAFQFTLPNPPNANVQVHTRSITLQNVGKKAAQNIEVAFQAGGMYFKLEPSYQYTQATTPAGD